MRILIIYLNVHTLKIRRPKCLLNGRICTFRREAMPTNKPSNISRLSCYLKYCSLPSIFAQPSVTHTLLASGAGMQCKQINQLTYTHHEFGLKIQREEK